MTHICVSKQTIIGSDNSLSPGQAIIWTNAGILLIGPMGTKFNEILIEIQTFSFKKMHLKTSSGKWRPFCLGLNVLIRNFDVLFDISPNNSLNKDAWCEMPRRSYNVSIMPDEYELKEWNLTTTKHYEAWPVLIILYMYKTPVPHLYNLRQAGAVAWQPQICMTPYALPCHSWEMRHGTTYHITKMAMDTLVGVLININPLRAALLFF